MLLLQWHENKMKNVALQHAKQGVDSSMYLGSNSVTTVLLMAMIIAIQERVVTVMRAW